MLLIFTSVSIIIILMIRFLVKRNLGIGSILFDQKVAQMNHVRTGYFVIFRLKSDVDVSDLCRILFI